jgi:putative zinc finger/helix-turn-helix YgiT family protein
MDKEDNEMATEVRMVTETYHLHGQTIAARVPARFDLKTGRQVFDEALDEQAIQQAFTIYRRKNQIISVQRIKTLRQNLGLSQRDFAALLGWSPTTIATYETGTLPSHAHNSALLALEQDQQHVQFLFTVNREKISQRGQTVLLAQQAPVAAQVLIETGITESFQATNQTIVAGYQVFDLKKFGQFVSFFLQQGPHCDARQLNDLLATADFTFFGQQTVGISGMVYCKPATKVEPIKRQLVYGALVNSGVLAETATGYQATQAVDETWFTALELATMQAVAQAGPDEKMLQRIGTADEIAYDRVN